ncbi:endonuclease III [Candidatus Woesearchaeota archaeon]|nr:endonuclease III [Candidatus Woesearchaeota archaeon]
MQQKDVPTVMNILEREVKKLPLPIVSEYAIREGRNPFKALISTVLSLRTKDSTTSKATDRLFALADNPIDMQKLPIKKIEEAIYPVGFYITKAKRIPEICRILLEQFDGKVPDEIDVLLTLPGVGRKTANLVLTQGYGKLGICVDTHVHRISNRLGYVKTKMPDETEFALRKKLPTEYWIPYNDYLVAWGQNICKPISPLCSKCAVFSYCDRVGVAKSR